MTETPTGDARKSWPCPPEVQKAGDALMALRAIERRAMEARQKALKAVVAAWPALNGMGVLTMELGTGLAFLQQPGLDNVLQAHDAFRAVLDRHGVENPTFVTPRGGGGGGGR